MKFPIILRQASDGSLLTGQSVRLHPGTDTSKYSDGQGNNDTTEVNSLFTDNNDGSYYKTITVSGVYSITVSGSTQDELTGIYIDADDNLTEALMGSDFTKTAGFWVLANEIIKKGHIDPEGGGQGKGLSGNGLYQNPDGTLKVYVDGSTIEIDGTTKRLKVKSNVYAVASHNHDGTYVIKSVDTADFEIDSNGKLKLTDRSVLDGEYITENESIAQNIRNLDDIVKSIVTGQNLVSYRTIYGETLEANTSSGSTPGSNKEWQESSNTYVQKIKVTFNKKSGDRKLILRFEGKVS